jgi:hypothetical protein
VDLTHRLRLLGVRAGSLVKHGSLAPAEAQAPAAALQAREPDPELPLF